MDSTTLVAIVLVNSIVFGVVGALIGQGKEAALPGFLFGFFLNVLGLIVVIFALDNREQCPACKSGVTRYATLCAKCRTPLEWSRDRVYRQSASDQPRPGPDAWPKNKKKRKTVAKEQLEAMDDLAIEAIGPPPNTNPQPPTSAKGG